jgi:hypothetical protein
MRGTEVVWRCFILRFGPAGVSERVVGSSRALAILSRGGRRRQLVRGMRRVPLAAFRLLRTRPTWYGSGVRAPIHCEIGAGDV